jgi:class I fructose-bisphosphate aldolase
MAAINKLSSDADTNVLNRPTLETIAHNSGMGRDRFSELYRMFYINGPGNGTMLSLPFDQLVEHGIGHTFKWDRSADPRAVIELANRGTFSAIALSIGQAEKYQNLIRPDLSLIVKVDGHFLVGEDVPYDRHSNMATVERAIKAGANAIGFTFYFGGNETERDAERVAEITDIAHQFGKPVFAWMYARGQLPEKMGADSLYWCAQAVSAGESLGVDVVKQKVCAFAKNRDAYIRELQDNKQEGKGYFFSKMPEVGELIKLEPTDKQRGQMNAEELYALQVKRLAYQNSVAPGTLQINSGGLKGASEGVMKTTNAVMDAGMEGAIVGRNNWGRPIEEALELNKQMVDLMRKPVYHRKLSAPWFTGEYETK